MPVGQKTKLGLIRTSAMKVTTANTQWSRPKMATLRSLEADMIRTVWGKNRALRCAEIVTGVLHNATDLSPTKAMAWAAITNARRIMLKDPKVAEATIEAVRIRERRGEKGSWTHDTTVIEPDQRARAKQQKPKPEIKIPKPRPMPADSKRKSRAKPLHLLIEAARIRAGKKCSQIPSEEYFKIHGCARCRYKKGCTPSCIRSREARRTAPSSDKPAAK